VREVRRAGVSRSVPVPLAGPSPRFSAPRRAGLPRPAPLAALLPPFANARDHGRTKAMSRAPASASASALARRGVKRKRAEDADEAPLVAFYSERGSFARVLSRACLCIPGTRGALTRDRAMRRRIARRAPRRRAQ
jgi:hypothetical protein